ncbi:Glutamate--cysteine ligase [hydrothermal vent metagenome]|uniref:glutamate--cysteine ligase n=1 Tax=hydrothermal vent metagenome TaxID=652676 RepID=A0A3B0YTW7_9ZZZZ
MYAKLQQRLQQLDALKHSRLLQNSAIGVEKESLRVNREGSIAATPHPLALGSALTHPYITTDYSEALTEFITPPFKHIRQVLDFLRNTQQFVYQNLDDEFLWSTSMPCVVAGETSIPIADYGSSNQGRMKHVYRVGLGNRYGRVMQVIAGVHFNYSFPPEFWPIYSELEGNRLPMQDFISESYMGLIRNLQRFGWLIPYLFGSSPAICKSFLGDAPTTLKTFNENTYYDPYATSLRMGDIGYQNNKENESGIKANYDSLQAYIASLTKAIETPSAEYEKLGIELGGEYRQLNTHLLQIENEYYSTIRPKQLLNGNEKPTLALQRRGIAYVELRSLDINAFDPLGINERQLHFLEAFLLFCLLQESPKIHRQEWRAVDENELRAAHRGRDPKLNLARGKGMLLLRDWGQELLEEMYPVCELLDRSSEGTPYCTALNAQIAKMKDPELTPSAQILNEMRRRGEGFYHFAKHMSEIHQHFFTNLPLSEEQQKFFQELSTKSLEDQQAIEAADELSFSEYLQRYFSQR